MEEKNEQNPDVEQETKNNDEVVEETSTEKEAPKDNSEDIDELKGEIGKLKRLLSKKEKETTKDSKDETSTKKTDKEGFGLTEQTYLATQGIEDDDEVDLAERLQKETGKELVQLVKSKYFQSELKELRDAKATVKATSDVKGGGGTEKAVNTPEYWIEKGVPPTKEQVPDNNTRRKIARAMLKNAKGVTGKRFYND